MGWGPCPYIAKKVWKKNNNNRRHDLSRMTLWKVAADVWKRWRRGDRKVMQWLQPLQSQSLFQVGWFGNLTTTTPCFTKILWCSDYNPSRVFSKSLIIEQPGNNNPLRHPPQDIVIAETLQSRSWKIFNSDCNVLLKISHTFYDVCRN